MWVFWKVFVSDCADISTWCVIKWWCLFKFSTHNYLLVVWSPLKCQQKVSEHKIYWDNSFCIHSTYCVYKSKLCAKYQTSIHNKCVSFVTDMYSNILNLMHYWLLLRTFRCHLLLPVSVPICKLQSAVASFAKNS
jgi:hypothetical protein